MEIVAPLAVAIPFAVAALLMAAPKSTPRVAADALAFCAAGSVAVLAGWFLTSYSHPVVYWFGGWAPRSGMAVGIGFFVDLIAAGSVGFAAFVTCGALVVSWHYFDAVGTLFHALLLILLGGLAGFCLTGDLFNLFVFYELIGVSAYALTSYKIEEAGPIQGGINVAVLLTLGASFVLMGVALLYGRTGVLNMADIGMALGESPPDALVIVAFVLLVAGLAIKSGILPFHFAHADAHAVAPTPVLVVFSGFFIYAGLYGIGRSYWTIFSGTFSQHADSVSTLLVYAGAGTTLVAGCMSMLQHHLKRLLAFVSISHAGFILIGLGLFTAKATAGAFLYLAAHGCAMAALFAIVGLVIHWCGDVHDYHLYGQARPLKVAGIIFGLGALIVAGAPPFGSFLGKAMIEEAAAHEGRAWVSWVFIAASAMTAAAIARAGVRIFLGRGSRNVHGEESEEEEEGQSEETETETESEGKGGSARIVITALAAAFVGAAFALGTFDRVAAALHAAADLFQDPDQYRNAFHADAAAADLRLSPVHLKLPKALAKSAFTVLLAAALAAATLYSGRVPPFLQPIGTVLAWPLRILRRWHSGHVGDYVVWMIIGIAVFGAAALSLLQ